jgi:alanine racemase
MPHPHASPSETCAAATPLLWAEVDLAAIEHNLRELRRITRPSARLMAVVKANAYGHGSVAVARAALQSGADFLGVARIDEALALRAAGLAAPILVLGYTPPERAAELLANDLTQTVFSPEAARLLSTTAVQKGRTLRVHLKVDTGMGRIGLPAGPQASPQAAVAAVLEIARLPGLELEGVFTHFASADSADKSFTHQQLERFMDLLDLLCQNGLEIPMRHAANSAAIIDLPETHLDMVRAGIALYGLYPSDEIAKNRIRLIPAMTLKARVVQVKSVPAGFSVSYGMTFRTERPTTIATIPVGYADGYSRALSSRGRMLIREKAVSIAGRVCMDMTMVDAGEIPEVAVGDEVVIFGRQGAARLGAEEVAEILGTISYEVVSALTARVPRVYVRGVKG